jgi:hypothetical protein
VRALKQMLDHPLYYRSSCKELDRPQNPYKSSITNTNTNNDRPKPIIKQKMSYSGPLEPRINETTQILDNIKNRKAITETNLNDALNMNSEKSREYERAKRLLEKAEIKYQTVKNESLKIFKPKNSS